MDTATTRPVIDDKLEEEMAWLSAQTRVREADTTVLTEDDWDGVEAYVDLLKRQSDRVPELLRENERLERDLEATIAIRDEYARQIEEARQTLADEDLREDN